MHPSPVKCTLQSAGRSLKKKVYRVSGQGLSKQLPIFLLQRYRSARQSPVQNDVLGLEEQLEIFYFLCTNMAAPSFFKRDRETAVSFH